MLMFVLSIEKPKCKNDKSWFHMGLCATVFFLAEHIDFLESSESDINVLELSSSSMFVNIFVAISQL